LWFARKGLLFQKNVCGKVLQNEKRPWSSVDDTRSKILFSDKIYFEERIKEITSERINQICWDSEIIPTQ